MIVNFHHSSQTPQNSKLFHLAINLDNDVQWIKKLSEMFSNQVDFQIYRKSQRKMKNLQQDLLFEHHKILMMMKKKWVTSEKCMKIKWSWTSALGIIRGKEPLNTHQPTIFLKRDLQKKKSRKLKSKAHSLFSTETLMGIILFVLKVQKTLILNFVQVKSKNLLSNQ